MTTQQEVADAFFAFENTPSTASNLEIVLKDGSNSDAALVSAKAHILAEREGLDDVVMYRGYPQYTHESELSTGWVRRQQRQRLNPALRHSVLEFDEVITDDWAVPPHVTSRENINL